MPCILSIHQCGTLLLGSRQALIPQCFACFRAVRLYDALQGKGTPVVDFLESHTVSRKRLQKIGTDP
jgi:hypothetical protein